jgi:hypothetical protein
MSDDDFLRELAQANQDREAEERSRLDERWDRLSAGELSPGEEAELRALAAASPEAREAYEAFRPLGPEFQASVVRAIQAQGLPEAETAVPEAPKPPAKVLPFLKPALVIGWSTAAAAAAAAMLVLLVRPSVPLPAYTSLEVSGGSRTMRGGPPEGDRKFAPGDRIQVTLPAQAKASYGKKSLEAQGFLSCDHTVRPLEAPSQVERNGAVRIKGSISHDVHPGPCTVWAVVCRRGNLPEPADLQSLSTSGPVRQEDCVAVPREIRIQPRGP